MSDPTPPTRVPYFDNARFLLVLLVVLGHAIGPLTDRAPALGALYLWIYAFHMPALVFLSGHLSRGVLDARGARRIGATLVIPYVVFQTLYLVVHAALIGDAIHPLRLATGLFSPYWLMWYLASLVAWRLALPVVARLRGAVALSVLLGIAFGYVDQGGLFLGLARTFLFFPFFVLGHAVPRDALARERSGAARVAAAAVLVVGAVAAAWGRGRIDPDWVYGYVPYARIAGGAHGYAGAFRLIVYAASTLLGGAFLVLVPTRRVAITDWGKSSLYAYLLHGFAVRVFVDRGFAARLDFGSPVAQAALVVGALALGTALSTDAVRRAARFLVEPPVDFLFRQEKRDAAA